MDYQNDFESVTDFLMEESDILEDLHPSTDKFESLEDVALLTLEAYANFHIFVLWDLRDCLLMDGTFQDLQKVAERWMANRTKMLCDNVNSNFKFSTMVPKWKRSGMDFLYEIVNRKLTPGSCTLLPDKRKYLLKLFMTMHRSIQSDIVLPICQIHDVMLVSPSNWNTADTLDMLVRLRAKLGNILSPELKIF